MQFLYSIPNTLKKSLGCVVGKIYYEHVGPEGEREYSIQAGDVNVVGTTFTGLTKMYSCNRVWYENQQRVVFLKNKEREVFGKERLTEEEMKEFLWVKLKSTN